MASCVRLGRRAEDVFKGRSSSPRTGCRCASRPRARSCGAAEEQDRQDLADRGEGRRGKWNIEYIAFFATPLNDSEIQVKFFDITGGGNKYVAGDPQYTREKGSRIFGSSIELAKPEFDVRKQYRMTIESRGPRDRVDELLAAGQG
jgi:hypothetical protein